MTPGKPHFTLLGLLLVWLAAGASPLLEQYSQTSRLRPALTGKNAAERAAYFDSPGFRVAQEIAQVVPLDACVTILAYAGPDAVTYYRARFRYLLYPRRVHVAADPEATVEGCEYLADFRDSPRNLSQSPFAGEWDQQALSERLRSLQRVAATDAVDVYRSR